MLTKKPFFGTNDLVFGRYMTYTDFFPSLPAHARLWVYGVDRMLNPETEAQINAQLGQFMSAWQSHGRKVIGQFAIVDHRFIVIGADIPEADISGCGIDASVHALEETGNKLGFALLSGLIVFYRDRKNNIHGAPRATFRKLVRSGEVSGDTIVFDTSLVKLSQLRDGQFELPAQNAWHATVFRIPSPTT